MDEAPRELPIVVDSDAVIVGDVALDGAGAIAGDLLCRQCGYNLRGLRPDGQCPECAGAIGPSLRGDRLCFADSAWVRRLALGARWTFWGLLSVMLLHGANYLQFSPNFFQVLAGLTLLSDLAGFRGAWLLTGTESRTFGSPAGTAIRRTVRIALAINLVGRGFWLSTGLMPVGAPLFLLFMPTLFAVVVGEFARLLVLERLARRIPDAKRTGRFRFLRWAYSGEMFASATLSVCVWLILVPSAGGPSNWLTEYMFVYSGLGLIKTVLALIYLANLWRLGSALYAQARLGQANWGAGALPGVRASTAY